MRLRAMVLILTLALGLLAVPLPAEGQKPEKAYRVGILTGASATFRLSYSFPPLLGFRFAEGDLSFERRAAVGSDDQLPGLAAELVRLKMDVLVTDGTAATQAAAQATQTIPIVMLVDGDPVRAGLVAPLARPDRNVTGMTALNPELAAKRLRLFKEVLPGLTCVGVLWNPANADKVEEWRATEAGAELLRLRLESLEARPEANVESVLEGAIRAQCGGLLVLDDRRWHYLGVPNAITVFAARNRLPAMYPSDVYLQPGRRGLMSYGPSHLAMLERIATYVQRILKGAKPADLPVEQPTKFEFVVNLKTAKALGLTIPRPCSSGRTG